MAEEFFAAFGAVLKVRYAAAIEVAVEAPPVAKKSVLQKFLGRYLG